MIEEQQDYQRASAAYLVWPLAVAALIREDPAASRWTRIHMRQAFAFGLLAGSAYVIVMALPLLIVIAFSGITTGLTVGLYSVGLVLDVVAFVVLAILAFSYSARAGRGELFTIPLVSWVADRTFTIRR